MSAKETQFDRRIVARNIKHGRTSRKEFDQYLASLPDVAGKAVAVGSDSREDEPDDLDDE